jgi:hypothetical protein
LFYPNGPVLKKTAQTLLDGTPGWIQSRHVEDQTHGRQRIAGSDTGEEPMKPRPPAEKRRKSEDKTGRYGKSMENPSFCLSNLM